MSNRNLVITVICLAIIGTFLCVESVIVICSKMAGC